MVAGPGNNGADGRAAAPSWPRGVRVTVLEARTLARATLPPADLVIDAAYGTGFHGPYEPPDPSGAAGAGRGHPHRAWPGTPARSSVATAVTAALTVTFQAYKPGLLLGEGPERAGRVEVVDIGLGAGVAEMCTTWLVTDPDVSDRLPRRPADSHKWQTAVLAVAGHPG